MTHSFYDIQHAAMNGKSFSKIVPATNKVQKSLTDFPRKLIFEVSTAFRESLNQLFPYQLLHQFDSHDFYERMT